MEFGLTSFSAGLIAKQAADKLIECNRLTAKFGLALTAEQARELVQTRSQALSDTGRIEFGGGATEKIIKEFCDSPYISRYDYVAVLNQLTEIFYLYKNETLDLATDEELIKFMKKSFDGVCAGSLELLADRELYEYAKNLRFGRAPDYREADAPDPQEEADE